MKRILVVSFAIIVQLSLAQAVFCMTEEDFFIGVGILLPSGRSIEVNRASHGLVTGSDEIIITGIFLSDEAGCDVNLSADGFYSPGEWNVSVHFNLSMNMDCWTNVTARRVNTDNISWTNYSLVPGGEGVGSSQNFSHHFSDGEYEINVSMGNADDPAMWVRATETFSFQNVTEVKILTSDVYPSGHSAVNGSGHSCYANETMYVNITVTNAGNEGIGVPVTVRLAVISLENGARWSACNNTTGPMDAGTDSTRVFRWTPPREGSYLLNVTYNCSAIQGNAERFVHEIPLNIQDVESYAYDLVHTTVVDETTEWNYTADLSIWNRGNVKNSFNTLFVVTRYSAPVHETSKQTEVLGPGDNETLTYTRKLCDPGLYRLNVTFMCDGTEAGYSFTVSGNNPPVLEDLTEVIDAPYPGDAVHFTVSYSDEDNDAPEHVRSFIDGVWNITLSLFQSDTLNGTMSAVDPEDTYYRDGKLYEWTWTPGFGHVGAHNYSFLASDGKDAVGVIPPNNTFSIMRPPIANSTVFGRVTTEEGEPVSDAKVVIFNCDQGDGDVCEREYFNTTTDDEGNYLRSLRLGIYFIYTNVSGYNDSDVCEFTLPAEGYEVEKNFLLMRYLSVCEDVTGEISGHVLNDDGAVIPNATVAVVIYDDFTGHYREYHNLTDRTDSTGFFRIVGILPGTWVIFAEAVGYIPGWMMMNFTTCELVRNLTLMREHMFYRITGTVIPGSAGLKAGYVEVEVNSTTGYFVVEDLLPYNYTLMFTADGYESFGLNLTITDSDVDIGLIILDKSPIYLAIGPVVDDEGEPVAGVRVSFTYDGIRYESDTDVHGMATFSALELEELPGDVRITASGDDLEVSWNADEEIPPFVSGAGKNDGIDPWMILALIAVALLLAFVIISARSGKRGADEGHRKDDEPLPKDDETLDMGGRDPDERTVKGHPDGRDKVGLEAYRTAVAQVLRDDHLSEDELGVVDALRRKMDVPDAEHEEIVTEIGRKLSASEKNVKRLLSLKGGGFEYRGRKKGRSPAIELKKKPAVMAKGEDKTTSDFEIRPADEAITCKICFGVVKPGLPVFHCGCGKQYHLQCMKRVSECPGCGLSPDLDAEEKLKKEDMGRTGSNEDTGGEEATGGDEDTECIEENGGDEDTKEKVATGGDEDTKEKVATGGDEDTQGNEENGGDQDTVGKEATGKRSPNEENSGDDDVGGPVVTLLDESALCKVCFGTIKTGLQAIECGCGSTYHLNCGRRVGACPGCDASFEALL